MFGEHSIFTLNTELGVAAPEKLREEAHFGRGFKEQHGNMTLLTEKMYLFVSALHFTLPAHSFFSLALGIEATCPRRLSTCSATEPCS